MKKSVAIAITALAALGAPLAIGQSQSLKLDAVGDMATGAMQVVQTSATSFRPPVIGSAGELDNAASAAPNSSVAWLMALGFLGLVVIRRTRSSSMR